MPSGFKDFDELTAGLQPSDLIIVAGRPSMGKTAFALNIAKNAIESTDKTVLIFSLEMAKEQLSMRMLCTESRIDSSKIRTGFLNQKDWEKITTSAGRLSNIVSST